MYLTVERLICQETSDLGNVDRIDVDDQAGRLRFTGQCAREGDAGVIGVDLQLADANRAVMVLQAAAQGSKINLGRLGAGL